ncbi:MAG: DUF494 family protein [Candidatus Hydrogenedens sp.]|nr:DUF494 family protein [Candidatus Hydrogenedens sp.]
MKTSITELITVILQHLESQPGRRISDPVLRQWLSNKGYSRRDIETALRIMRPANAGPEERGPGRVRHLSKWESLRMHPDVRSALARLDLYEMLDPFTREMVLERLQQLEGEVALDDLDSVLSWAFSRTHDCESLQTLYTIFDGASETLH